MIFSHLKIHKAFTMMKRNGRPVEVLTEKLILCLKFSIFNGFVETVAPSQPEEEEEHLQLKNKGSKHTVNGAGGQTQKCFDIPTKDREQSTSLIIREWSI